MTLDTQGVLVQYWSDPDMEASADDPTEDIFLHVLLQPFFQNQC